MRRFPVRAIVFFLFWVAVCSTTQAQAYQKNDINISAGYGIASIWKYYLRDLASYGIDYKVHTDGPVCFLADYAVFKNISIGLAAGQSETRGAGGINGFELKENLKSIFLLVRGNFHPFRFEKFDPFIGGGIGYYHFKYINELNSTKPSRVPGNLGLSAQLGGRYYFYKSISVFAEVGFIAGSLAEVGLCVRIR